MLVSIGQFSKRVQSYLSHPFWNRSSASLTGCFKTFDTIVRRNCNEFASDQVVGGDVFDWDVSATAIYRSSISDS